MSAIAHSDKKCTASVLVPGETVERLTFERLFREHGPLVEVEAACKELGFNSRDTFMRAVNARRIPLDVIRPPGRHKAFVATIELASYLARLANPYPVREA
jgi:hypothetical protein